jgi:uncharacterized protein (TIGR00645 family)
VLKVLALIDISLVGSLIVMVMFSGYENFVSTHRRQGHDYAGLARQDGFRNAQAQGAASIVAISSIHLLRIFMQVETTTHTNDQIMWYVILHMTFVCPRVVRRARQDVVRQAPRPLSADALHEKRRERRRP